MTRNRFISVVFALTLFLSFGFIGYSDKPTFSYKVYGNIANYFESENDLLTFFEFKKGQTVAEIGANDGQNVGGLLLLTDSVNFFAQDINPNFLNEKSRGKIIKRCEKYKKPITGDFKLCIGSEHSSNLPDGLFDKIILSSTFHEFTYMDEMINDIYKKLKPGGKVYILESVCMNKKHKNYTAEEITGLFKKHGFTFLKKDGKDLNGSQGLYRLIFVR